jgi:hypothetical protein
MERNRASVVFDGRNSTPLTVPQKLSAMAANFERRE